MRSQHTLSQEFKRRVVEELLTGESRLAHSAAAGIASHQVCSTTERDKYRSGEFNNERTAEADFKDRIGKLESLVGQTHPGE